MRKFLFTLLCIVILSITIYVIIEGISFAGINGYKKINEINNELDNNIAKINQIKEVDYINKEKSLNTEVQNLNDVREEYLAKVEAAKIKGAKGSKVQIEVYELEFIWARVGNYASDLGLEIKLDVSTGIEEKSLNDFKLYNLKFSVLGDYTDIVRFIYKIEGDSEISAQLSDFSMKPVVASEEIVNEEGEKSERKVVKLVGEFTLKNVPLNHKNILETVEPKATDDANSDNSQSQSNTDKKAQ